MPAELKLCPFCGKKPSISETEGCDWVVSCCVEMVDDMKWGDPEYNAKDNVVSKWNKRAGQGEGNLKLPTTQAGSTLPQMPPLCEVCAITCGCSHIIETDACQARLWRHFCLA